MSAGAVIVVIAALGVLMMRFRKRALHPTYSRAAESSGRKAFGFDGK
jgi:hypothetical protein